MKTPTIIPYCFTDSNKKDVAFILCKHANYEAKALIHMIRNLKTITDTDIVFRLTMRIVAQTAIVSAILTEYNKYHKYLFPVITYLWAEPIGNGMYKIPAHGQLLLNAPME